jgi:hypothetical protein
VIALAVAAGVPALVAGVWEHQAYHRCAPALLQDTLNFLLWGSLLIFAYCTFAVALGTH